MDDAEHMRRAMALAATVRTGTAPNPWVGCVVVPSDAGRTVFEGATAPPGGPHAEVVALAAAGGAARGATLVVTLEPCAHHGRTPPCTEAIIEAGIARVVVGVEDPDEHVAGRGIAALREAGIVVSVGVAADEVAEQLAPYLKHRRTGRPWVVLKMAASLDGRTAAPDGTVRADDPQLTVRLDDQSPPGPGHPEPIRVVLGTAPAGARVHPALELSGELDDVLGELGRRGVLQLLVEGGASVAHDFHAAGLVDRYIVYLAPAFFGGDDARPLFAGRGAGTIGDVWKGRLVSVARLGDDLRVEVAA